MLVKKLIHNLDQIILSSVDKEEYNKSKLEKLKKELEDNQIIEEYEGECEECSQPVQEKICQICEN